MRAIARILQRAARQRHNACETCALCVGVVSIERVFAAYPGRARPAEHAEEPVGPPGGLLSLAGALRTPACLERAAAHGIEIVMQRVIADRRSSGRVAR